MTRKTFYIKTFGCQMNERDSEIMAQLLNENGYTETFDHNYADLIILNTCSIREKAEQKVMSLLGALRKQKIKNPDLCICVAGCVAQQEGRQLVKRMEHVDLVVGTQNIYNLPGLLLNCDKENVVTGMENDYSIPAFIPKLRHDKFLGTPPELFKKFVTIMQGCNNYCSYCVVPHTRGREVSRKISDIIDEVAVLVEGGVREITLLGQNVNSYGQTNRVSDSPAPESFADLLRQVAAVEGLKRLRFTTSNPKDLSEDLMKCFAEIDILCPQFHLPVQSGSNNILRAMNRKYTREHYLEKVAKLRHYCPEIAITTDIIVGFPGESDADFEQTMLLLDDVCFHGSFSFKYSDRPGTRSAGFADKIEEGVKAERLARFQARQDEISIGWNRSYVGTVIPVMIECNEHDRMVGRSETNHLVHFTDLSCCVVPGDIVQAMITHAGQHSLQGELKNQ